MIRGPIQLIGLLFLLSLVQRPASVEQTAQGAGPAQAIAHSFDGLGAGLAGARGSAPLRNPSDNSLAVADSSRIDTFRFPGCTP